MSSMRTRNRIGQGGRKLVHGDERGRRGPFRQFVIVRRRGVKAIAILRPSSQMCELRERVKCQIWECHKRCALTLSLLVAYRGCFSVKYSPRHYNFLASQVCFRVCLCGLNPLPPNLNLTKLASFDIRAPAFQSQEQERCTVANSPGLNMSGV
jgi:hypothetical protein